MVSVLSYSIADAFNDQSAQGSEPWGRFWALGVLEVSRVLGFYK